MIGNAVGEVLLLSNFTIWDSVGQTNASFGLQAWPQNLMSFGSNDFIYLELSHGDQVLTKEKAVEFFRWNFLIFHQSSVSKNYFWSLDSKENQNFLLTVENIFAKMTETLDVFQISVINLIGRDTIFEWKIRSHELKFTADTKYLDA